MPVLPETGYKVTIANGQTVSGLLDLKGVVLQGVFTPSALTGTVLKFQASRDGAAFVSVRKSDGTEYTITVAPDRYTPVDPALFAGIRYLKVVSGSTEGGSRDLYLSGR
jgi:hypothetical protein